MKCYVVAKIFNRTREQFLERIIEMNGKNQNQNKLQIKVMNTCMRKGKVDTRTLHAGYGEYNKKQWICNCNIFDAL